MTIRTIKVDITGLKEIEKAQKSVSALRDSVLDFEKKLKKMGGKNTSPLSFNVNLNLNTDKALRDFLSLKKQIENIPINVRSTKGKTTESSVISMDKTQVTRPKEKVAEYVKVRDQDYQSWRNLHKAVQDVTTSTMGLSSQMIRLGAVNPAKGLLSVFNKVNSTMMGIQNNIMGLVGNKVTGAISNAIQGTLGAVKSGVGQLKDEANNLGDAMQVYRINMEALGFSEKETNKSIKRLGDYGKASVFDATDLLEQASTYTAYGRKDAEDIVRGYAGLLAQTKNPVQGMKTVTTQTSQMLANGYLNQGDYRFIRERLSALGASKLNEELLKIAQSKGEDSITDATRKKLITANEYLDAVNKLGNQDIFQNLVTSIVTPRQAIANFKETLSNLLVFDEIDEEGNAKPGALNKVYVATRDFIKGITDIVSTDKFKEYVTKLGNAIGGTIQQVNQFSSAWKLAFGNQFLKGIEQFASDFQRGVKGLDVGSRFFNITKDMLSVLNNSGKVFGEFTKNIVHSASEFLSSISQLARQGIDAGVLKVLSQYVDVYNNLAKLTVKSEAIQDVVAVYDYLSNALNNIVKSVKPQDVKDVFGAIRGLAVQVITFVEDVATKTNLISNFATVIKTALEALAYIVKEIKGFNQGAFNKAVDSLRDALVGIINHLKPLLAELGKGIISTLSSYSGDRFFKAVEGFIKAVTNAIKQTLVAIGGSVEGGLKQILDFLSTAIEVASGIATLLGGIGKYILLGYVGTKFVSWATNIITSLKTVATAMNSVSGGRVNPLGLGSNFSRERLARQGMSSYDIDVAYSGMSRASKNTSKKPLSRTARNKAIKRANITNLATLGADLVLGGINGAVQDSGASQGTKDFTNVLSSTASWALTGATIGSAVPFIGTGIGALVGGVAGLGLGLWDNHKNAQDRKRLTEEAQKEAKEQSKEEYIQQQAHLREISEQNNQIRDTYFKTITKDTSLVDSVVGANSTIEAIKNNSGTTVEGALSQLGIEVAKVPQNVDSLFVKIGDQVKSWKELKESTGYTDEQLLQSLQLAKSAIGEKFVELVNETGQEVVAKIPTLTSGEQHRQSSNIDTFKGKLGELGLKLQEGKELVFKDISSVVEQLQAIQKDGSLTGDAKSKAIDEILNKLGVDTTEFVGKTIAEKMDIVTKIIKEGDILGGSSDHQFAGVKQKITEKVGDYSETLGKVVERIGNTELDGYLAILTDAETISSEGGEKADIGKILEFKDKVLEYLNKGYLKIDEAKSLFEKAGISNVSIEQLKDGSYKFNKTVTEFVNKGTKYINDGSTGLKAVPISVEEKHNLFESAKALAYEINRFIERAIGKLEKAKEEAKKANDYNEVEDLVNEQNLYEGRRNSTFRAMGGLIPEYHSQGLPVGFKSRGTDTVPAMLTPGEYVLRKKAVDSLGTNFLNNLNKYGVNALQTMNKSTIINNVYNTNNAKISQNIDNKSQYLNGMFGVDKLMRYV